MRSQGASCDSFEVSIQCSNLLKDFVILGCLARYPSGLREWSAKPSLVGSNPTRASIFHTTSALFLPLTLLFCETVSLWGLRTSVLSLAHDPQRLDATRLFTTLYRREVRERQG